MPDQCPTPVSQLDTERPASQSTTGKAVALTGGSAPVGRMAAGEEPARKRSVDSDPWPKAGGRAASVGSCCFGCPDLMSGDRGSTGKGGHGFLCAHGQALLSRGRGWESDQGPAEPHAEDLVFLLYI